MIEIEFEPPKESVCDCCGNTTIKLVRFVYKDDSAFAVYYAQFTKDHPEKRLSGLIGIGEWGDGASPDNRMAFPFQIWSQDDGFMVGMVDREDSSYSDVTLLGKMLDRRESLSHELIDEVFHITDHMVRDDPEIVAFFGNE